MVLPGAPLTPMSCTLGRCQSPMQEMLELPYRSSWPAPSIACRRPAHTISKTTRKGIHPSITFSSSPAASGRGFATRYASPSLTSRSGSNVALARRAAIVGMTPNALARISPSPRHASAQATTHTSSSVKSATARPHRSLILLLVHIEVPGPERRPFPRITQSIHVLSLEDLVARVVRRARREVGTAGSLDDAVGHRSVDAERADGSLLHQVLGGDDPLARDEPALGRSEEDVVEIEVGSQELARAEDVRAVHVHERDIKLD